MNTVALGVDVTLSFTVRGFAAGAFAGAGAADDSRCACVAPTLPRRIHHTPPARPATSRSVRAQDAARPNVERPVAGTARATASENSSIVGNRCDGAFDMARASAAASGGGTSGLNDASFGAA